VQFSRLEGRELDEAKHRDALRLAWSLVQQEHASLTMMLVVVREIIAVLSANEQPTREQLNTWTSRTIEIGDKVHELTTTFKLLSKAVDPLCGIDA